MSIAAEAAVAARAPRLDAPFLIAAALALAVLLALVLLDGQPAAAALLVSGFALGRCSSRPSSASPRRGGG